jgi:phenylalanyl-tRNA synthetase beta chain
MICSERELGLSDESQGILVLDPAAPVGAALDSVLAAGERVLEVALTPNRGDCASLLGIAREVRAHFGGALRVPPTEPDEEGEPAGAAFRVEIDDRAGCLRYVGRLVRGVTVGPSPAWLQRRLEGAGLRAINIVVDVTNLVLLELGQPLHAFDAAKLHGGVVRVRRAGPDEKLATLDGQTRALAPDDLVIADAEHAVALAGVMGGAHSQVGEGTTDVFLESAHFDPVRVRRTARRLGLVTEASYRFERQIDRAGVRRACERAARLLAELAGGSVAPGVLEAVGDPPDCVEAIDLDPERANRLLGTSLARGDVVDLLARVEVAARDPGRGPLRCRVPSWRNDLRLPVDLVEEVARIHGYERIPARMPRERLAPVEVARGRAVAESTRDALCAAGFVECMTLPFASASDLERIGLAADDPRRRTVRVMNPLSEEESQLRSTLVPALLGVVRSNRSRQVDSVRVFEMGRVFRPRGGDQLPEERLELAAAVTASGERLWATSRAPLFFDLKGATERVLDAAGVAAAFEPDAGQPFLHPGASARIEAGGRRIGFLGELHPDTAGRYEIDRPCALLVVDLDALAALPAEAPRYREVSNQPSVWRDIAVLLPQQASAGQVLDAIRATAGPLLVEASVFDRYEGPGVTPGRVSVAFRVVFQCPDRTLTDAEVTRATERVVAMLADRFQGELRQGGGPGGSGG